MSHDDLLGRPAPQFSGALVDGSEFELASLRGRVVLMDFWATWCGPCVAAIPTIQKVADKYADQPVTVLGINSDRGDTKKVLDFMERRKISFTQFMDDDGDVGRMYGVSAIPCTVLIDKDGVVQDIHIGGSRTLEKDLSEKIDKLLAGERLVEPKPEGTPRAQRERVNPDDMFPPIDAERFVEGRRTRAQVMPMGGRELQNDHGGLLLLPAHDGRLLVVGPGAEDVRTIRLAGVNRAMVSSVVPATLGGTQGWVVSMTNYGLAEGSASSVAFFDDRGARKWTFAPQPIPGTFSSTYVDVGDLTGDGRDEVVVALTYMPSGRGGRGVYASYLVVLDESGEIMSRRRIGRSAYGVWIAKSKGEAGTVLVIEEGIRRFTLSPSGLSASEPDR